MLCFNVLKQNVCYEIKIISEQEHVNCVGLHRPLILSSRECFEEELDCSKIKLVGIHFVALALHITLDCSGFNIP